MMAIVLLIDGLALLNTEPSAVPVMYNELALEGLIFQHPGDHFTNDIPP